jgi:hypothetical protein
VTLQPDPAQPGSPIVFQIDATIGTEVKTGFIEIDVSYQGLMVYTETKQLCDIMPCPVKPGPFQIKSSESLPPIVPPGPYELKVIANTTNTDQLMCLLIDFNIQPPWPPAAQKFIAHLESE